MEDDRCSHPDPDIWWSEEEHSIELECRGCGYETTIKASEVTNLRAQLADRDRRLVELELERDALRRRWRVVTDTLADELGVTRDADLLMAVRGLRARLIEEKSWRSGYGEAIRRMAANETLDEQRAWDSVSTAVKLPDDIAALRAKLADRDRQLAEVERESAARLGALVMVAWRLTILGHDMRDPTIPDQVRHTVREWLEDAGATAPEE